MGLKITGFETSMWKISLLILCFILLPNSSHAHKIKIFATATENILTGYGYYPGGGKYRNGTVEVYAPGNQLLGEIKTNENGEFSFKAAFYCDHTFIISTKDGHRAQYTVTADELPAGLPLFKQKKHAAAKNGHATDNFQSLPIKKTLSESTNIPTGELKKIMTTVVAEQVIPLREQIDRYEQKIRLHDILGGIGYILGIFGIAFYFYGRKKSQKPNKQC